MVVQLAAVMTLVFGAPIHYLVVKYCVKQESSEGSIVEQKKDDYQKAKKDFLSNRWTLDISKPRIFIYIDEFMLKPMFIRDYHNRKLKIAKMKEKFEAEAKMYSHDDHGHDDAHGHGDHSGHGGHGGHGGGSHGGRRTFLRKSRIFPTHSASLYDTPEEPHTSKKNSGKTDQEVELATRDHH